MPAFSWEESHLHIRRLRKADYIIAVQIPVYILFNHNANNRLNFWFSNIQLFNLLWFFYIQAQGGSYQLTATFTLNSVLFHLDETLLQKNFTFVSKISLLRTSGLYMCMYVSIQIKFIWKQRFAQKGNALYIERIHQVTSCFLWKMDTYGPFWCVTGKILNITENRLLQLMVLLISLH